MLIYLLHIETTILEIKIYFITLFLLDRKISFVLLAAGKIVVRLISLQNDFLFFFYKEINRQGLSKIFHDGKRK